MSPGNVQSTEEFIESIINKAIKQGLTPSEFSQGRNPCDDYFRDSWDYVGLLRSLLSRLTTGLNEAGKWQKLCNDGHVAGHIIGYHNYRAELYEALIEFAIPSQNIQPRGLYRLESYSPIKPRDPNSITF